ncbi:hypothetical protein [Peijinzhouia sedimentorum]
MKIIEFLYYFSNSHWIGIITTLVSVIAFAVAFIAMYYTRESYILKKGANFRGTVVVSADYKSSQPYISQYIIENLKDRSIAIYGVFLKIGRGSFLELENFNDKPFILKGFESHISNLGIVYRYLSGQNVIDLREILIKGKYNLILSTSEGKYTIEAKTEKWDPHKEIWKNIYTDILIADRYSDNGIQFGDKTKYIVKVNYSSGKKDVWPVLKIKANTQLAAPIKLTEKAVSSKSNLEIYLREVYKSTDIESINVIDFDEFVKNHELLPIREKVKFKPNSFFEYEIRGRFFSKKILDDRLNRFLTYYRTKKK